MLFSVLIANYNNSRYLDTALSSVRAQTYDSWEVVLVDDGSTDGFDEVMAAYADDPRIRVIRNDRNYGCGYTKRRCAAEAQGDLAGFLDPDDALHPSALQVMVDAHRREPAYSIIHSTHYICDEALEVKRIAEYPRALPENTPYLMVSDGRIHHFASFKMSRYRQTGGLSPKYPKAVDQDLYYRLEETGGVLFIDRPLYYYRIHASSISNAGREAETMLWHYDVILEACRRRIAAIGRKELPAAYLSMYRARYHKIAAFRAYRRKQWHSLAWHLIVFPFNGGFDNLVSYLRKLPREGMSLLRRSFVHNYEIKP